MAGKIPDETLDAIRDRVSLVEVVSGYVSLKKSGRNYLGLCPFHSEKTPSFTVSDERGLFHCFGCGAGGTVFTFVMRMEHCSFPEAVESLARRTGVVLPSHPGREEANSYRQDLFRLNEFAQKCFRRSLEASDGDAARRYLERRGLRRETIERYGLGYCPPDGSGFTQAVAAKPKAVEAASHLGLIGQRRSGGVYERFWNRVTFPIRDGSGRILGFGGRALGEQLPKYLNSPESALFHKGRVLYGLFEARAAIREAERVVVVEGYMDALALTEAGIGHVVAGLGTALTVDQLKLARRFAPQIVAFFDGDQAGQRAAERAFTVCLDAGIWGLGAFLPEGVDPDTYVRTEGVEKTIELLDKAVPLATFFLDRVAPRVDASLPERARAAEKVGEMIARVEDPVMFSLLVKDAAERLGVDESIFRDQRTRNRSRPPAKTAPPPEGSFEMEDVVEQFRPEELMLVEVMALDRSISENVAVTPLLSSFESKKLAHAAAAITKAWSEAGTCAGIVDELPVQVGERIAASTLGDGALARADLEQVARDCISRIEQRARKAKSRSALARLREIEQRGDTGELRKALERSDPLLRQREDGSGS